MDHFPLKICITDNRAFLFGTDQLSIVTLDNSQPPTNLSLDSDTLVDACPALDEQGQPSVYAVFFSRKKGYYSRNYNRKSKSSFWEKISRIMPSFAEHRLYSHFQVLIPNILALASSERTAWLYDLQTMTATVGIELIE
jgi:hypothetical protein